MPARPYVTAKFAPFLCIEVKRTKEGFQPPEGFRAENEENFLRFPVPPVHRTVEAYRLFPENGFVIGVIGHTYELVREKGEVARLRTKSYVVLVDEEAREPVKYFRFWCEAPYHFSETRGKKAKRKGSSVHSEAESLESRTGFEEIGLQDVVDAGFTLSDINETIDNVTRKEDGLGLYKNQ